MDALKRLFGAEDPPSPPRQPERRSREMSPDERAVDRYRYLLRTAPAETVEEAHAEAFAQLTPEQRRMVLQELAQTLTPAERAAEVAYDTQPDSLARLATRAEMRQPGTLERTWSGMAAMPSAGGVGFGGLMMGNFLGTFAGVMLGSMVADAFLNDSGYDQGFGDGVASAESADPGAAADTEMGDSGVPADSGDDFGGFGDFGGDMGGFGDFGGEF